MKTVIGVIGQLAAGKDSTIDIIKNLLDINSYQISDELKRIAKQKNIELSRENLILLSRELVKVHGDGYLAELIINNSTEDILLIGGMRQLGQIEFLNENTNLILIGVNADHKLRFNRMKNRGKFGDPSSLDEFIRLEKMENKQGAQKTDKCISMAKYLINNQGTIAELELKIKELLKKENLL